MAENSWRTTHLYALHGLRRMLWWRGRAVTQLRRHRPLLLMVVLQGQKCRNSGRVGQGQFVLRVLAVGAREEAVGVLIRPGAPNAVSTYVGGRRGYCNYGGRIKFPEEDIVLCCTCRRFRYRWD